MKMKGYKILLLVLLGTLIALTGAISVSAANCNGYYPCGSYFYQYRPAISWNRPSYNFGSLFSFGGYGGWGGNYGGYRGYGNYGGYGGYNNYGGYGGYGGYGWN
jgi:hypothetical protein